jgi:tRNA-dihydrouridine synthase
MIGRAAMDNPWIFATFDREFYDSPNPNYSRREILLIYANYA